jgi:predicted RNA-binding Zn-ribbon protein involved in translation (DUF1610 family)
MDLLADVRDMLRTIKHRRPSKMYCPKCASPNIHTSKSFDYWLFPAKYVCEDCGYDGPIFMELEKDEGENQSS